MSTRLCLLAAFATAAAALAALAQSGDRPMPKSAGAVAKAKGPIEDTRRLTEIAVELAWLADPITFPYFLEAKIEGATVSVRGFVPDKAVRDQVLRLARLYSAYSIADAMKEHPSLRVRPGQVAPAQLQGAVTSALREALPRQQAQRIQVTCAADGKVTLRGPMQSAEEKLAASLALRRLYGCTSVQNLTVAPGGLDVAMAKTGAAKDNAPVAAPAGSESPKLPLPTFGPTMPKKDNTLVAKAEKSPPVPTPPVPTPPIQGPNLAPSKNAEPPAKKSEPVNDPAGGTTAADLAKKLKALSPAAIATLQKHVQEAVPAAKEVKVEVAMNKLRIALTVRSEDQISPSAEKAFAVPDLADYREVLELEFTVGP